MGLGVRRACSCCARARGGGDNYGTRLQLLRCPLELGELLVLLRHEGARLLTHHGHLPPRRRQARASCRAVAALLLARGRRSCGLVAEYAGTLLLLRRRHPRRHPRRDRRRRVAARPNVVAAPSVAATRRRATRRRATRRAAARRHTARGATQPSALRLGRAQLRLVRVRVRVRLGLSPNRNRNLTLTLTLTLTLSSAISAAAAASPPDGASCCSPPAAPAAADVATGRVPGVGTGPAATAGVGMAGVGAAGVAPPAAAAAAAASAAADAPPLALMKACASVSRRLSLATWGGPGLRG